MDRKWHTRKLLGLLRSSEKYGPFLARKGDAVKIIQLTTKYEEKLSAEKLGEHLFLTATNCDRTHEVDLLFTKEQAEQLKMFLMENF